MSITALRHSGRVHRSTTASYLARLIESCDQLDHFSVFTNPLQTGAMQRVDNPPRASGVSQINERLIEAAAVKILTYDETQVHIATAQDTAIPVPCFNIIGSDLELLRLALEQERQLAGKMQSSTDMIDLMAWKNLPVILRSYWNQFNDDMHVYIFNCMKQLTSHQHAGHYDFAGTLFTSHYRDYPHIPVSLESGDVVDLITFLNSIAHQQNVDLKTLMPSHAISLALSETFSPRQEL